MEHSLSQHILSYLFLKVLTEGTSTTAVKGGKILGEVTDNSSILELNQKIKISLRQKNVRGVSSRYLSILSNLQIVNSTPSKQFEHTSIHIQSLCTQADWN